MDARTALALLEWQIELGVDETIGETGIDRYALSATSTAQARPRAAAQDARAAAPPASAPADPFADPVAVAAATAMAAGSLADLRAAMAAYAHCDLKRGARNLVFADGVPGARVMVIGEAPGREEDQAGKPFVGAAGQLLDRMLAAIGLSRGENVYITNVLPWRPPQNRDPKPEETAMMRPFLERHVALADPDVLVLMGNFSCEAVLGTRGITRLRGNWAQAMSKPVLPMFHPAFLLRRPAEKRKAWEDLLTLKSWLRDD